MSDFVSPAATYARARAQLEDPEYIARQWWERRYKMPSHGNPAFEQRSLAEHGADLLSERFAAQGYAEEAPQNDPVLDEIAKHLAAGRDPLREMFGEEAAAIWSGDGE